MADTMYWGIKLDPESVAKLLSHYPPVHPNVYAEHMTIAFRPPLDLDETYRAVGGSKQTLMVMGYAEDEYGQAVAVVGFPRHDPGVAHVTISCANGVSPVYSNKLLAKGFDPVEVPIVLTGTVGRVDTNKRWDFSELDSKDTKQETK